ncbi:MAG: hypothetical protein V3U92_13475 [Cellulophaga sp.]
MNNTEQKWMQYYRDAARMWLDISIIQEDIKYTGTTYYAVDTNIILLYADPLKKIESVRAFSDEKSSVLEGMAISVANFIFFDKNLTHINDSSLLFPTPLIEEFLDIYQAITRSGEDEKKKALIEIDKKEQLVNLINSPISNDDLADYLTKDYPNLVRYLDDENSYINSEGIIKRLKKLAETDSLRNIETNSLVPIPDQSVVINNKLGWQRELKKILNGRKDNIKPRNADRIANDAKTLAWLSWVNLELDKRGTNSRILYITDDEASYEAVAEQIRLKKITHNFIRHPRQYTHFIRTHDSFKENSALKMDKFKNILNDFLSLFAIEHNEYISNLRIIVQNNHKSNNKIMKSISQYRTFSESENEYNKLKEHRTVLLSINTISNHLCLPNPASALSVKLRKKNINLLLQEKQDAIFKEVAEQLRILGLLGVSFEFRDRVKGHLQHINKNKSLARGPVSLRRSEDKGGDKFFESIHTHVYDGEWSSLFNILKDSSNYIQYLIVALVAADAGDWKNAKEFCRKAMESAIEGKNNEALYFMAVALRHSCRDASEYKIAKNNLTQFKFIWSKRYKKYGRIDYRFKSEELALKTAYFNYKKFMLSWDDELLDKPIFSDTWNDLLRLAKEIEKIENINMDSEHIWHRIRRQVYSNQCCMFLLSKYGNDSEFIEIDNKQGEKSYNALLKLKKIRGFRTSYFINFLLAYIAWCLDAENKTVWKTAVIESRKALKYQQIPYEKNKYTYFITILEEYGTKKYWDINLANSINYR